MSKSEDMTDRNDIIEDVIETAIATIDEYGKQEGVEYGHLIRGLEDIKSQDTTIKNQRLEIERLKDEMQRLLDYPIQTDLAPISLRKLFKVEAMALAVKGRANP